MVNLVIYILLVTVSSVQQKPLDFKDRNVHKLPNNVWKMSELDMHLNKQATQTILVTRFTTKPFISSSKTKRQWISTPWTFVDATKVSTTLQHFMSIREKLVTTENSLTVLSVNHSNIGSRTNASVVNLSYISYIFTVIGAVFATFLLS